jgi:hypothetical protein
MIIFKPPLFLSLAIPFLLYCGVLFQDNWQFRPGALMASDSQMSIFKDAPGQLLSVNGFRRISAAKLEEVSIYHAIIFHPTVPMSGSGGSTSNDGPLSIEKVTWRIQKNPPHDYKDTTQKMLEIRYDALERVVIVGSQRFLLSEGNMFIIRLNEDWLPEVEQVAATFDKRADDEEVLKFFKHVLREDERIQKLELH